MTEPILEVRDITKMFGSVIALSDVTARVYPGEVTCLLGDNGAGKSTLIKILCGVHQATEGDYYFEGERVVFNSPREALERGIATVYQDLSLIPLMPIWRNFFLGVEPEKGIGPFKSYDIEFAKRTVREEMARMGIDIRDPEQPVGTMSGGERQSIAISRAVYFGARVLILDEPTAALGVREARRVLDLIHRLRDHGKAVVVISHAMDHVMEVADRALVMRRGRKVGEVSPTESSRDEIVSLIVGGDR